MLLEMSISGGLMVILIVVVRKLAIHHLPKRLLTALWDITLLRLLVPFYLPFGYSIVSPVLEAVDTAGSTPAGAGMVLIGKSAQSRNNTGFFSHILETDQMAVIWLAGMILLAVVFAILYVKEYQKMRTALPVPEDVEEILRVLAVIPKRTRIMVSDNVYTPLTFGVIFPKIILPKIWAPRDDVEWKYVLTHEAAHIRRADNLRRILLLAAACIHWFNLFVWIMYVLCNRDAELSCDEKVIALLGEKEKKQYAMTLVRLAEKQYHWSLFANGFGKNAIQERIVAIMKYKKITMVSIVCTAVFLSAAFTVFAKGNPELSEDVPETHTVKVTELQKVSGTDSGQEDGEGMIVENKVYKSYGITFDSSTRTTEYQGKKVAGIVDENEMYVDTDAGSGSVYLQIKDGNIKEISKEQFNDLADRDIDTAGESSLGLYLY